MTTALRTRTWRRGLAFLAGVGFAAVPTVGPYLAILAIASGRLQVQRADRWWWAAALLLGLPWIVAGHAGRGVGAVVQALSVWLIFRTASEVRQLVPDRVLPSPTATGLLLGFAAAIAVGLERSVSWRIEPARSVLDLFAWIGDPALFGHAMLVMAALLAVVIPAPTLRTVALALGALAVVTSGAHEAVIAWLGIAVAFRFVGRRESGVTAALEWSVIAVMVLIASGTADLLGFGRTGYRMSLAAPAMGANLFRGTEVVGGEWWYPLGVRVTPMAVQVAGAERTGFVVEKVAADPWSRLQQIVELQPGRDYVLAVAWRPAGDDVRPGLDGWARSSGGGPPLNLAATWRDGTWNVTATPPLQVIDAAVDALDDAWLRGWVSFRYDGIERRIWYVGAVPDRRLHTGGTTTFAEFQLTESAALVPYAPSLGDVRLADLRLTRLPLWREAVDAIAVQPWWGWGPGGFARASAELRPDDARNRPVAAHAHNLLLDTWVERGVVGLAGLVTMFAMLGLRAVQQRDGAMATVLAAIAFLNVLDATLFNGAIVYPLAAVLGWRAVGRRVAAQTQTGVGSAAAVRLALAGADALVAAAAISVGLAGSLASTDLRAIADAWTPALGYTTLLWVGFAWAFGLYPGYGLPLHAELDRHVRAAVAATAVLALAHLAVPDAVPVAGVALLLTGLVATVAAPLARAATKDGLRAVRLWGRPVVILGTGPTAERVARYLLERPTVGLAPVAAFGASAWGLRELPVSGDLEAFWRAVPDLGVQHAIVTPDARRAIAYDDVLRRSDRRLRIVQFVPDLHGLPTSAVVTTQLGTSIALEVRNRLASSGNRAMKRALDLTAVVLGGILALPVLLAIATAIRLDSRGPALYRHARIGRDGRTIRVWKFRSMVADADERLAELLERDPAARAEWEATQKLVRDPRVTRLGRFLRKTSLDELPQIWNVLAGDMSLVGPRPIVQAEIEKYGEAIHLYTQVRPGITGFWQVSGRSDTSYDYRVDLDAYYVRNWSVWLDLEILVRTWAVVLRREGAY